MDMQTHMHMHMHMHMHTDMHMHKDMHSHMHTDMDMHSHTHTDMHSHMHMQTRMRTQHGAQGPGCEASALKHARASMQGTAPHRQPPVRTRSSSGGGQART
jgi:hypothetical protein